MVGLAVTPSRPAADRDGQRSSVEGPPFAVNKEVALVARTDGIRQELHDWLRLLESISEVRPDQLSHKVGALAALHSLLRRSPKLESFVIAPSSERTSCSNSEPVRPRAA